MGEGENQQLNREGKVWMGMEVTINDGHDGGGRNGGCTAVLIVLEMLVSLALELELNSG